jgi:hypothetical protein
VGPDQWDVRERLDEARAWVRVGPEAAILAWVPGDDMGDDCLGTAWANRGVESDWLRFF